LGERADAREPHRRDGEGEAREQDKSLRHQRHQGRDDGARRFSDPCSTQKQRHHEHRGQRHHRRDGDPQDAVDVGLEGAERRPRLARLGGQTLGKALGADGFHHVVAGTGQTVGARQHGGVDVFRDRVAFAGEDRLVDRETASDDHPAVGDHLVAGFQPDRVARDDGLDGQLRQGAVAPYLCAWGDHQCQPVEDPLGPDLLDDPDQGVRHNDAAEQGVLRVAEGQRQHEQRPQHQVEEGEGVGADDLRI
jgi:hypothetical protein